MLGRRNRALRLILEGLACFVIGAVIFLFLTS